MKNNTDQLIFLTAMVWGGNKWDDFFYISAYPSHLNDGTEDGMERALDEAEIIGKASYN